MYRYLYLVVLWMPMSPYANTTVTIQTKETVTPREVEQEQAASTPTRPVTVRPASPEPKATPASKPEKPVRRR